MTNITHLLAKRIFNHECAQSLGTRIRAQRMRLFLTMVEEVFNKERFVKIIDVGGTEQYWNTLISRQYLKSCNASIVIVNLPGRVSPRPSDRFTFVEADGCDLSCFGDKQFHIAHSNSVLEHVGDWERMVRFANEIQRVAQRIFVQTPNYWFPVEPHCMTPFFHWLPKSIQARLLLHFSLGHWRKATSLADAWRILEDAKLLSKGKLRRLFPKARIVTERFMFLQKSFIVVG